ncbi:MAG: hypothetical protein U9Q38_07370 [Thermodesulfobacteriota bacterium]|nr:hypothetical protein [Thermodesulfobacteriota bacterium]
MKAANLLLAIDRFHVDTTLVLPTMLLEMLESTSLLTRYRITGTMQSCCQRRQQARLIAKRCISGLRQKPEPDN